MDRERLSGLVLLLAIGAGLLSYAFTDRVSARSGPDSMFAYSQQTFSTTRLLTVPGLIHSLRFRTYGGDVAVEWYDSSLASVRPLSGIYATLDVDGRQTVSALTGSYFGAADKGPATLRWAGLLPAGEHTFEIELARVDAGAQAPYVLPGQVGVDSLVVTQEPGD